MPPSSAESSATPTTSPAAFGQAVALPQAGLAAAESTAVSRQLVRLGLGGYANALFQIADAGNHPGSACGPVQTVWLQVIPPNQTAPLRVRYKTTPCS